MGAVNMQAAAHTLHASLLADIQFELIFDPESL